MSLLHHFSSWYPPAEATLPMSVIFRAMKCGKDDFALEIKKYLNVGKCSLGLSGRALLSLLLIELKEKAGLKRNQVLIPGYTCYSVPASIVRAGLKITCYDINPITFEPDIDSVHAMAGDETLAIIGQHLFGIPTPMEGLMSAAHRTGACFIEDAAQALGGVQQGKALGTSGDFGLLSFGRGKPLPLGGGGALVGQAENFGGQFQNIDGSGTAGLIDAVMIRILSHKRIYGFLEMLPLGLGKTIFNPDIIMEGMPKPTQKLGAGSLCMLDTINNRRLALARVYEEEIIPLMKPPIKQGDRPVYTRYPVLAGVQAIPKSLYRSGVRRMYPNAIMDEPSIRPYCSPENLSTPGSSSTARNLITLPTHSAISEEAARHIARRVREVYQ